MGRDLPQRATRGRRMAAQLDDEEEAADNDFWNQEFFKEEAVDDDYKTESEPEDIIDSDFDDDEEADDDEEVEVRDDEPRKKALKPPGRPKSKPKPKPKVKKEESEEEDEGDEEDGGEEDEDGEIGEDGEPRPAKKPRIPREPIIYVAPTLRRSTVTKVAEAEMERQYKAKPARKPRAKNNSDWRPLTQQELLAEAALNEIENTRSLKMLLAREEETKRKAQVVKKKNSGPSVKWRSRKGADGEEHTTLELVNAVVAPRWLQPSHAPPPPHPPICSITGLPARYMDPQSRALLANTLAFKRLRGGAGPLAPALQQQLVMHHHMEQAARQQQHDVDPLAPRVGTGAASVLAPVGPHDALMEARRQQQQRREALAEQARAAAATAKGQGPAAGAASAGAAGAPAPLDPPPVMPTTDLMALLVDVHRSLAAA
ncbi:hypothetical protein HYH02_001496 [Chlamydomonas schloesseri]|uniref:Vps72/YL1 C-terminal domain-containing protein n=1 Tax=Chlamydomonas schloesseri TaxID=2026947 RepID=A0A836BCQ9_9CHLO|nr:hypothetical protein HYH02_001496 [Chlamydomonas schloesseri]|eukprot:KAG2454478.1 hypothetical protein HYH02_001496 [Chlamydomonas schloesseri]